MKETLARDRGTDYAQVPERQGRGNKGREAHKGILRKERLDGTVEI